MPTVAARDPVRQRQVEAGQDRYRRDPTGSLVVVGGRSGRRNTGVPASKLTGPWPRRGEDLTEDRGLQIGATLDFECR